MIISENKSADLNEFKNLMIRTDKFLNDDAKIRPKYYISRSGSLLEDDVFRAINESSKNTIFYGTIKKISGQHFPDIIALKIYGIEVKSTKYDQFKSTGSSILESTRVPGIEKIYLTFGKLGGDKIQFISKPYEECLSGIAVTHMPRYLIDMKLEKGETIFDKIGLSYDELRKTDNPVAKVSEYYRKNLKPGESLWWVGNNPDEIVSPTIRLWKNLSKEEKRNYKIYGFVNYPEIFGGNYDKYTLYLASQGIVDPHVRDQFSAGGKVDMFLSDGSAVKMPHVYSELRENLFYFINFMKMIENEKSLNIRLIEWCDVVSKNASMSSNNINYKTSINVLRTLLKI